MKKILLGICIGVLLTISQGALASGISSVGKKIQGEFAVSVDGVQLSQKAIVVDGTSYAPLRAVGESIGYDVNLVDKTVEFTMKGDAIMSQIQDLRKQLGELDAEASALLTSNGAKLGDPGNDEFLKKSAEIAEKRKELQAQIEALQAQLNQ